MSQKQCPKCRRFCKVSEALLELGLPIECVCGCKFEVLPGTSPSYHSQTEESQTQQTHTKTTSPPEKKKKFLWKHLFAPSMVIAGVGLAFALWQWNWPKSLFVVSVALTIFCWRQKRRWKKDDNKSSSYFFFDKCVEFFVPLTSVMVLYAILAWMVDGTADQATLGRLQKLESQLNSIHSYVAWFKLKPWIAALFLIGVIVLDLFLSSFFKYKDMASWYTHYNLWSKRVCTVVVLLCCFTFFGNAVGERNAHLRTNTDRIREGYARIQEKAEEILTESVQQQLYEKVQITLPSEIRAGFDYPQNIAAKMEDLRVSLKYADVLGVRDQDAAEIIRRYETSAKEPPGFYEEPIRYSELEPVPQSKAKVASPPAETTAASVEKTLAEIETRKPFRSRLIALIKLDGTKQLFCQFPKSFTNVAKSAIFKAAMVKYPLLEPVVDVFIGAFDKSVEEKVKSSADQVADALLKNSGTADQVVAEEAGKIVDSVKVKESPSTLERVKGVLGDFKQRIRDIDVAIKTVENRMNAAAEAQADDGTDAPRDASGNGVGSCSCYCGSRRMWGPVITTAAQCRALCPPVPCR
jgi:hypothetical protein